MVNLWPFGDEKWPPDIWAGGPLAPGRKIPEIFLHRFRNWKMREQNYQIVFLRFSTSEIYPIQSQPLSGTYTYQVSKTFPSP